MKINSSLCDDNKTYRLGISGGMACGKSTVARQLLTALHTQRVETHYLDVDTLRRALLESKESATACKLQYELRVLFGSEILKPDGAINRRLLSDIVFADSEALKLYEALIDPIIFEECARFLRHKEGLLLLEWALLFEKKMLPLADYNVLLVECSASVQLERLSGGDLAASQVAKRVELQGSQDTRLQNIVRSQIRAERGEIFRIDTDRNVSQKKLTQLADLLCSKIQASRYPKYG